MHVRQLADERVDALDCTLDVVVVGEYGAAVPHRADPAVERRELLTEPLLLAVPSRHRASGASIRLAELGPRGVDRRGRATRWWRWSGPPRGPASRPGSSPRSARTRWR